MLHKVMHISSDISGNAAALGKINVGVVRAMRRSIFER
jgi:hypothetical protein